MERESSERASDDGAIKWSLCARSVGGERERGREREREGERGRKRRRNTRRDRARQRGAPGYREGVRVRERERERERGRGQRAQARGRELGHRWWSLCAHPESVAERHHQRMFCFFSPGRSEGSVQLPRDPVTRLWEPAMASANVVLTPQELERIVQSRKLLVLLEFFLSCWSRSGSLCSQSADNREGEREREGEIGDETREREREREGAGLVEPTESEGGREGGK